MSAANAIPVPGARRVSGASTNGAVAGPSTVVSEEGTTNKAGRYPTPALEEAWTRAPLRCDLVKKRVYLLLGRAVCVTALFLWGGVATLVFGGGHQRGLGTALTCTGIALALVCWTVFLCTTTQRSRTFLAAVVPGCRCDDARLPPSTVVDVASKLL